MRSKGATINYARSGRSSAPGNLHQFSASQSRIFLYWALVAFVIIFPKSGVKAGTIPLTTGYAAICVAALLALTDNLLHSRRSFASLATLGLSMPFGSVVALSLTINGSVDQGSALAAVMSFIVTPGIFLGLFSCQFVMIPWPTIRRSIVLSVRFVAVFGLILFVIKLETGTFLEIPYLTVNAGDAGLLESTKNIDRSGVYKLISTYNNGNLFGASMLLLLPLYFWAERSRIFLVIVVTALILTLSRTVWIGLLVASVLTILQRRLTARLLIALACGIALFLVVVWVTAVFISNGVNFLMDPTLGGRSSTLEQTTDLRLLPATPVIMLPEIVYAGVVQQYGLIGLLEFIAFLFAPVIAARMRYSKFLPMQRHAALGIYTYAFICFGDGAIMLIPVIPIFLLVSLILLEAPRLAGAKMRHHAGVLHGPGVGAQLPRTRLGQVRRTYFGRPSSSMRLGA